VKGRNAVTVDRQIVYQPRSRVPLTAGRGEKNARRMIKGEFAAPRRTSVTRGSSANLKAIFLCSRQFYVSRRIQPV